MPKGLVSQHTGGSFPIVGIAFVVFPSFMLFMFSPVLKVQPAFGIFICLFLSIFLYQGFKDIYSWWSAKHRIKKLMTEGECIRTVIDRIDLREVKHKRDGRTYYDNIRRAISKDSSGNEYKSRRLYGEDEDIEDTVGLYINVYVDQMDNSNYYMDFDSLSANAVSE